MKSPVILIDFCICTYNRKVMLQRCLETLLPQVKDDRVTVTVIDNRSDDGTKEYVVSLLKATPSLHYIYEPTQGLSHARNTGWKDSSATWIYYLDDDSIAAPGLVTTAFALVDHLPAFDAYGGPIVPAFEQAPPAWFPKDFGAFSLPVDDVQVMEDGYIRGCNMMFRRSVLLATGGFHAALGVNKDELGYGEEIDLQDRMRGMGYRIAYAPGLRVEHIMRVEKISLRWLLASEYVRRRDKARFSSIGKGQITWLLLRTLGTRFFYAPYFISQTMIKRDYPLKAAIYDTLKPVAYRWGDWIGSMKTKIHRS